MLNLMGVLNATAANVSCTCNCKRFSSLHSMEITQLEFVQILVIVVVMMVMVVVITCLLNHYRLSARSLLSRHGPARRRHLPLANEGGSLWCSEGAAPNAAVTEQVYSPRPPDRGAHSSYLQREAMASQRFQQAYVATAAAARFQPTYPYLPQSLIDLPPTISLSDGEEPPPYQGPCTLQLRDPEQQMELNRESVRAPPNRTVFDSHPLDPSNSYLQPSLQAPPPSLQPGLSMLDAQDAKARHHKPGSHPAPTPPPPAYSEVMGHYYHATSPLTPGHHHHHHHNQQQRTVSSPPPSSLLHGLLRPPPPPPRVDHRNARNAKEKPHKPQQASLSTLSQQEGHNNDPSPSPAPNT